MKLKRPSRRMLGIFLIVGIVGITASIGGMHYTSRTAFCISCHEVRIVAEQGWMQCSHYQNKYGVVAQCADCHLPPGPFAFAYAKIRYGLKDFIVHHLYHPDPYTMDWNELRDNARAMIKDASCKRCHANLVPAGGGIKMILAHRQYLQLNGEKRCLDCHTKEFHPKFKEYLFGKTIAHTEEAEGEMP